MRVIIDTNQLVAALVRPPELATLLMAWESGRFTVVASEEIFKEYRLVLKYPSISPLISPELLRAFEQNLTHDIDWVEPAEEIQLCRDPDDDKFITAAVYGLADYLVTVDNDLKTKEVVAFLGEFGIQIIDGTELVELLDNIAR